VRPTGASGWHTCPRPSRCPSGRQPVRPVGAVRVGQGAGARPRLKGSDTEFAQTLRDGSVEVVVSGDRKDPRDYTGAVDLTAFATSQVTPTPTMAWPRNLARLSGCFFPMRKGYL